MNVAFGIAQPSARHERELQARRRKAEARATRERARNSRIALVGFFALAAVITFGVRTSWEAPPIQLSMKLPADAASRSFAQNHMGRLFFDSLDGAICREMRFNNDDGRFSDDRTMRCDDAAGRQEDVANAPMTDARARAFSIRGSFSSR